MADIVAIHGINMQWSLRTAMQREWRTAIVDGLACIRSPHAQTVSVECAFYGHEYNDGKAGREPEYAAIDIEPGLETELVIGIGTALDDTDDDKTKLYLPGMVQSALARIQRSELFDGRDARLISFVKQVNRYLSDPGFRALVHAEVTKAMAQSPRLVIGHSLGSVIAYNWLRENDPGQPVELITLGSPLGFEAIRRVSAARMAVPAGPGGLARGRTSPRGTTRWPWLRSSPRFTRPRFATSRVTTRGPPRTRRSGIWSMCARPVPSIERLDERQEDVLSLRSREL